MIDHSAAVCQCSSRMPPAVNLISTPAMDLETASSRIVTSRDHPPSCMRFGASPKGYLKVCTPPASVGGGKNESGFCPSSAGLPGPGALALRSLTVGEGFSSWPAASADDSMPAAASAADPIPRNPRRENVSFSAFSLLITLPFRRTSIKKLSDLSFLIFAKPISQRPQTVCSHLRQQWLSSRLSLLACFARFRYPSLQGTSNSK